MVLSFQASDELRTLSPLKYNQSDYYYPCPIRSPRDGFDEVG